MSKKDAIELKVGDVVVGELSGGSSRTLLAYLIEAHPDIFDEMVYKKIYELKREELLEILLDRNDFNSVIELEMGQLIDLYEPQKNEHYEDLINEDFKKKDLEGWLYAKEKCDEYQTIYNTAKEILRLVQKLNQTGF